MKVIRLMASVALSDEQLHAVKAADTQCRYTYTGSGYYLAISHASLPVEPKTLSDPPLVGNVGEVQAGFVVFLGNKELTLECHTWGAVDVPENFRDQNVVISTPPVNFVDLRNAT